MDKTPQQGHDDQTARLRKQASKDGAFRGNLTPDTAVTPKGRGVAARKDFWFF